MEITKYQKSFYSTAFKLTKDKNSAKELVQDTLIKFWEKKIELPNNEVERYGKTILHNLFIDKVRKENRLKNKKVIPLIDNFDYDFEYIQSLSISESLKKEKEKFELVEKLFVNLQSKIKNPETFDAFVLTRFLGKTFNDVSKLQKVNINNICGKMHRTTLILKKHFNMKPEITLKMLANGTDGQILASGECFDNEEGLNMTTSHKRLRWVAKRGGSNDWAVYTHWATNSLEFVMEQGDQVMSRSNLENILNFTDEVYNRYRR